MPVPGGGYSLASGTSFVRIEVDDPESDYGHLELHVHQKYHLPLKMEFFDRNQEPIKTMFANIVLMGSWLRSKNSIFRGRWYF